jgi:hypothetical protein
MGGGTAGNPAPVLEYGWEVFGQRFAVGDVVQSGHPRQAPWSRMAKVASVRIRPDGEQMVGLHYGGFPPAYESWAGAFVLVLAANEKPSIGPGARVWHEERGAGRVMAVDGVMAMVRLAQHLWEKPLLVTELRPFTVPGPVTRTVGGVELTATWGAGDQYLLRAPEGMWVGPTADEVFGRYRVGREAIRRRRVAQAAHQV